MTTEMNKTVSILNVQPRRKEKMYINNYNTLPCFIVLCTLCNSFTLNTLIKVTVRFISTCELMGFLIYDF